MTITCCISGCKQRAAPGNPVVFHRFPKDEKKRKIWECKIDEEYGKAQIHKKHNFRATANTRICSKHFSVNSYNKEAFGINLLKSEAVPSVFSFEVQPPLKERSLNERGPLYIPDQESVGEIVTLSSKSGCRMVNYKDFEESVPSTSNAGPLYIPDQECDENISTLNSKSGPLHISGQESDDEIVTLSSKPGPSNISKSNKRKSYPGDFDENDVYSPRKMRKYMELAQQQLQGYKHKIKSLQQENRRLKKKVGSLHDLIEELKNKTLISESATSVLKCSATKAAEELFSRIIHGKNREQYPNELMSFALTLSFYSSKAYNYVREKVGKNNLPCEETLRQRYKRIDGSPGFTSEAFSALEIKSKEASEKNSAVKCALIIDEMSIRQQVEWDTRDKTFSGYVDLGTGVDNDELPPAKESFTFLVNAINSSWKVPIGYFLINGLSAVERANLVKKALCLIHETGVEVVSVTCDGHSTNIATMNNLGANINAQNLVHYFQHPITLKPIFVILDACHMLKLVRNALASTGSMVDATGRLIKWEYITELEKVQKDEKLFICKIGTRHIQWYREKMKVKLAAQTLSRRAADALLYLKHDANHGKGMPEFEDCEGTANFLLIINDLFDILNSRNLLSKGFKSPIKPENKDSFMEFLDFAEEYIRGLKTADNGVPILQSSRKTGFLGLIVCIRSIKSLYSYLCENGDNIMKFLLTYKLSQDHLETFFSAIRSKGGYNNNPNAKQFKAAYVRLIAHHEIMTSGNANCLMLDNTSILNVASSKNVFIRIINESTGNTDLIEEFDNIESFYHDHAYVNNNVNFKTLSCYVNDVVEHIAGFVVKKLKQSLKCSTCCSALHDSSLNNRCRLIRRKNRGGLVIPSDDTIKICKEGEKSFRQAQALGKLRKKNIMQALIAYSCREFAGCDIFPELKEHCIDQAPLENHINILIKGILFEYFKIRLYHTGKMETEALQRNKVRSMNSKTTLFKGQ